MQTKINFACLTFLLATLFGVNQLLAAPIKYKQTMTQILSETQFTGWPPGSETNPRSFGTVTNSVNGAKIAFSVFTSVLGGNYVHIYAANPDGTGVMDLTGSLPGTIDPNNLSDLKLDDRGKYLFFCYPTPGTATNVYYIDLQTQGCAFAVLPKSGKTYAVNYVDARKPYGLTTIGEQVKLYFVHDDGWDPVAERYNRGIYQADLGGLAAKVLDIDQLPGTPNLNFLSFLGSAAQADLALLSWNRDYFNPPATAMWKAAGPTRVPNEEHRFIWSVQNLPHQIISANGSTALYHYGDTSTALSLAAVDLASGIKTPISDITGSNRYFGTTLSPAGTYAFFSATGYRGTRHNLATGDQRDTRSFYFTESQYLTEYTLSDITGDDRVYFMGGKDETGKAKVHRIDMNPTDFSKTPNITAINFSSPRLVNDGTTPVTVTANVSDAQGLGTISWVKMQSLVDGLEKPVWLVGDPLVYDVNLYDDGTHGDLVAGDGIYTNNTIRTSPSCNFYQVFSLPKNVGVRIITRDQDYNYVMADTVLAVANTRSSATPPTLLLLDN